MSDTKRQVVIWVQRNLINPAVRGIARYSHGQVLLETTGRRSGLPRTTPIGGKLDETSFWLVSEHGERSQYIRNIREQPGVRVRINGTWRRGTAHVLPDDDAHARLDRLPKGNSAMVRLMGTDLLTVRIDFAETGE